MIKAGIFDVGGVLHSNETLHIYNDITKTLNIKLEVLRDGLDHDLGPFLKGEIEEGEFWKRFFKYTKTKGYLPKESLYGREYKKRFKKNIDVLSLLREIKNAGYKLAVLSDTITPHAEFNRKAGLYDDFDVEVLSNKVGLIKPDPEIFEYTLKKLNVFPNEAFFVDDLDSNVESAIVLGIHGVKYENCDQLERDLRRLGVRF